MLKNDAMRYFIAVLSVLTLSLLTLASCGTDKGPNKQAQEQVVDNKELNETLEKANRYMIHQESELIDDYVERHDLYMNMTGTGLRYQILKEGDGKLIEKGDFVTLEYEVRFLTGDIVYSSKESGNKSFLVGKGGVEAGLEEAILKLHKNDLAILILPAHLAHGLLGDGNRIPPRTALVYKVKVVDIQSYK